MVTAGDDDAWLLGDPMTSKLNSFFTEAIRELSHDANGFDAAFACVTSVLANERGAAWSELKRTFEDHPEASPLLITHLMRPRYCWNCTSATANSGLSTVATDATRSLSGLTGTAARMSEQEQLTPSGSCR